MTALRSSPRAAAAARFVANSLRPAMLPLWALFVYWICIVPRLAVAMHPPARLWIGGIWLSVVLGTALNVNVYLASNLRSPGAYVRNARCTIIRFYTIPFCVAAYMGLASLGGEESYWFIFPRDGSVMGVAVAAAVAFVLFGVALHAARRRWASTSGGAERRPPDPNPNPKASPAPSPPSSLASSTPAPPDEDLDIDLEIGELDAPPADRVVWVHAHS
eukprot:tig00021179_g19291.t1